MIDIKALCKQCANREICKYTEQACSIYETIEIEHPFSVEVKCKYFRDTIPNPRTRTVGI